MPATNKITATSTMQEKTQIKSKSTNEELYSLIKKISDKNKIAFEQFYDSTIKLCFSQALRITKSEEMAEEVIGDVYMQVWNKAVSYDEQRSGVITWLMMLCRSRALDTIRKRKISIQKNRLVLTLSLNLLPMRRHRIFYRQSNRTAIYTKQ
ncbi:MAG: hypothetical protein JKX75_02450 [Gammaproteobacteria bacterium]|nr:hypothetical protein [Gammaproteobacteria bacterium]